jgi:hypothetical protein
VGVGEINDKILKPGRRKSKRFLDVLPDGHGAEDVEEDEGAVSEVVAQKVSVRQALGTIFYVKNVYTYKVLLIHLLLKNIICCGSVVSNYFFN